MPQLFGWIPMPAEVDAVLATLPQPHFAQAAVPIQGSGAGKTVLLFDPLMKLLGRFPIHNQTIGDCVSHGWSLAVDLLKAVEIVLLNDAEQFLAETASEWIYHTSRVDIGRGQLGNEDGSLGAWAAKAVNVEGVLTRQKFGDTDLSTYSGQRAKQWGSPRAQLPADLYAAARDHVVKTTSLVSTYTEARDAIANGYPVAVCSQQGFTQARDADGFARASGTWGHCMCFIAADEADRPRRPGLLCMNSWGPDWINGPKRLGQPDGSFWVDAQVCDRMLGQRDSFALSSFAGYPARTLPETWLG